MSYSYYQTYTFIKMKCVYIEKYITYLEIISQIKHTYMFNENP